MAYSQILDLTDVINNSPTNVYTLDMGDFNSCTVQVVGGGVSVGVYTTNDGGAVQGTVENSAKSAGNFTSCFGIPIGSNSISNLVTNVDNSGLIKFENTGQYIHFEASGTIDKLLVRLYQVY